MVLFEAELRVRLLVERFDVPPVLDELEDLGRSAAEIRTQVVPSGVVRFACDDLHWTDAIDFDDFTGDIVGLLSSTNGDRG